MPEAPDKEQKTISITDITQTKDAGFASLYSNNVQILVTPWDLRMIFGEIQAENGQNAVLVNKMSIVMSPQHTKAFLAVLARNLMSYEQQHGTIPIALKEEYQKLAEENT